MGPLVDIQKSTVTTLYEFASQVASTANNADDGIICLRDEALLVKHGLSTLRAVVDRKIEDYRKAVEEEAGTGQTKLQNSELARLLSLQETVRKAVQEVAKVIKMAAEVEAIKSSRFDSLQLLTLLEQVPVLIVEILTEHITSLIDEIVNKAGLELSRNTDLKKAVHAAHPCLNRLPEMREPAIQEFVLAVTSELKDRISELKVVCNKDVGFGGDRQGQQDLSVSPELVRQQVSSMYGCVPDSPREK